METSLLANVWKFGINADDATVALFPWGKLTGFSTVVGSHARKFCIHHDGRCFLAACFAKRCTLILLVKSGWTKSRRAGKSCSSQIGLMCGRGRLMQECFVTANRERTGGRLMQGSSV